MLRRCFKLSAVVAAAVFITILAACGQSTLSRPQPKVDAVIVEVTGSCGIEVDEDTIKVSGETDIKAGAIIQVSVVSQSGDIIDSEVIVKADDIISCNFAKTQTKYADVESIIGYITFAPSRFGNQPEEIYDIYGENFENIEYKKESVVWDNKGMMVLFASEPLNIN